jgi:peroxiredoxin Q/BCP
MVVEGENSPDFTLDADYGKQVSLKDYLGEKVVLCFYLTDHTSCYTNEAVEFGMLLKNPTSIRLECYFW